MKKRRISLVIPTQSRLERYVSALPEEFRQEFRRYRHAHRRIRSAAAAKQSPYWKELPRWLEDRTIVGASRIREAREFSDDITWAQHCLFLFIRMQDDLFDGHAASPGLVYLADQFLFEADRIFAKHFARSRKFWELYRSLLAKTTHSIVKADTLQRTPGSNLRQLEIAYSGINSLFKIAPAAVCLKAGRRDDMDLLSGFADSMAVVGQIVDDLRDVEEDYRHARFNYAAQFLLGHTGGSPSKDCYASPLGRGLALNAGFSLLFNRLRHHLKRAEEVIEPLELPEAKPFLQRYRENLRRMQNHLNNRQEEHLFNTLVQ